MRILEEVRERFNTASDDELDSLVWQGILKLNPDEARVVSFVFWLVYLAENDLNQGMQQAWKKATDGCDAELAEQVNLALVEKIHPGKKTCPSCAHEFLDRTIHISDLQYFADKIKLDAALFNIQKRTKFLWLLNTLRNSLSHNRLNELIYNGISLKTRSAKEAILVDFVENVVLRPGVNDFESTLTSEQRLVLSDEINGILE